jgi:phage tail sheath protein FI
MMPAALTQPGVYIEEIPSGVRTITGVATSIALFLGWAPRGPVDRAVRIANFSDYQRRFGGLDRRTRLGHAVKQFFDNGGSDAYIVRLIDSTSATPAVPATVVMGDLTVNAESPGLWGQGYSIRITLRADDNTRFKIEVLDNNNNNAVVESFENLSMDVADPRFVTSVVNGRSGFITVAVTGTTPPSGTSGLAGAADGAVLEPNKPDFLAALQPPAPGPTTPIILGPGSITDRIDIFNLVCVPEEIDDGAIQALQKLCRDRRAFLIVDSPQDETVANMPGALANLTGPDAFNSAIFYPWVRAPDPLQQGALADFPPCGFVAGVFARTDSTRGVWKAPAGSDATLSGANGLAITMSDAENGQLNPLGINCLRTLPVYGNTVWGSRTLHGQNDRGSEWKYIPVRRMALFLEESLYRGTQWVVFEPNDEPLWAQIRLNIGAFLQGLFRQGAFQGQTPRQAYFVKCDGETTTQPDIDLGIVNILVGFAPLKPAEFVVIKIQQIAGDIPT